MSELNIQLMIQIPESTLLDLLDDDTIVDMAERINFVRGNDSERLNRELIELTRPARVGFANGPSGPDFVGM